MMSKHGDHDDSDPNHHHHYYNNIPSSDDEFYESSPCSGLWDQLLQTQFAILYFPFKHVRSGSNKIQSLEFSNPFQLCKYLAQHVGKFKEITKLQFEVLNPKNDDQLCLFFRTHLKGNSKVGKSQMARMISHGLSVTDVPKYEPTSAFKLLTRSYKLKLDDSKYLLVKGSIFDNSGTKTEFSRRSIFSPNVYAGKTSVLYVYNDEMESLEGISEWVKDTSVHLTGGIRVQSNSIIGSRDNSVSENNQKPPLELMVFNLFPTSENKSTSRKSWKKPKISLFTRVRNSKTISNALQKAKELGMPLVYCSACNEEYETVKFVNVLSHVLLCKMYDVLGEN
ncbi:hypothetical protein FDP41_011627 [Naegleria fowleri]|uniref:Uncharacterized protein n=1 Tax=Naegleria fowleri TaxID=5763 RepID=A0A6A5BZL1_NAEFO|nr:uncharacterized protein FDP41_011627 [Naegleria fowleri]KAF0982697.1 hypothetical protein FDP41_011627 [Naegleria fowleri]